MVSGAVKDCVREGICGGFEGATVLPKSEALRVLRTVAWCPCRGRAPRSEKLSSPMSCWTVPTGQSILRHELCECGDMARFSLCPFSALLLNVNLVQTRKRA